MDFRTEWSSWVMMAIMLVMSYFMSPDIVPENWQAGNIFASLFQLVGYPFFTIAFATIPVFIYCNIKKIEPDIDYAIRLGFVIMIIFFLLHMI